MSAAPTPATTRHSSHGARVHTDHARTLPTTTAVRLRMIRAAATTAPTTTAPPASHLAAGTA